MEISLSLDPFNVGSEGAPRHMRMVVHAATRDIVEATCRAARRILTPPEEREETVSHHSLGTLLSLGGDNVVTP